MKTALVGSSPAPADGQGREKASQFQSRADHRDADVEWRQGERVNTCYLKRTDLSPITGVSTNVDDDARGTPGVKQRSHTMKEDRCGRFASDSGYESTSRVIVDEYNPLYLSSTSTGNLHPAELFWQDTFRKTR